MFDELHYSLLLDNKIKAWLPNISDSEIDDYAKTTGLIEDNNAYIKMENEFLFLEEPKMEKKTFTAVNKSNNILSIFDSEEPIIKEDFILSSCCADNKMLIELQDDMEVAAEVTVSTDCDKEVESFESLFVSPECTLGSNTATITPIALEDTSSPLRDSFSMETLYDFNFKIENELLTDPLTQFLDDTDKKKVSRSKLHLDLAAVMDTSSQIFLANTPDVLRPVLDPDREFDLMKFLFTSNVSVNKLFYLCLYLS